MRPDLIRQKSRENGCFTEVLGGDCTVMRQVVRCENYRIFPTLLPFQFIISIFSLDRCDLIC
jgi:hypothetical protein